MTSKNSPETTDIFHYCNQLLSIKEDLFVEMFLVSKNEVPYATRLSIEVQKTVEARFIDPLLETVFEGAELGMTVKHISFEGRDDSVLIREDLEKVPRAGQIISWIEERRDTIEYFSDSDHDMRRMKGLVIRVTHKTDREIKFYLFQTFEPSKILSRPVGWQFNSDTIGIMEPDATFKVPVGNETLVIDNDIFIFNEPKFERMFKYNFEKLQRADKKAKEFVKKFKVSVNSDIGGGLENILRDSDALLNKFLKTDIANAMPVDKVVEVSDDMGLELMQDDDGAIIIMDKTDMNKMLDIINDNYYESNATGNHYVARSKKPIDVGE